MRDAVLIFKRLELANGHIAEAVGTSVVNLFGQFEGNGPHRE
jgi:hypothetical protein